MNIEKMSDAGAVTTVNEICDGLKEFIKNNPENAKMILTGLVDEILDPANEEDFWGTEGWKHTFGIS